MLKLSALIAICVSFTISVRAQNPVFSGTIMDTLQKKGIQNAVVAILTPKDSILYKFTRTDANGNYTLKNVKPGNYILLTTHPIFAEVMQNIEVGPANVVFSAIALTSKSILLQAVIVKSGSPIKIKGDTTVYTADSFKVRAGANVEELLRKLPGIQVDKNGKITAMGEQVKKVLVDGEEFFGDDPGIATKNLRADVVKEVEVFDKKSDQAAFTGIDDGVKDKTINLKLKDNAKKGYFGKMEAGTDFKNFYNNSAMVNAFKGKRKIAAYAIMSNTGKTNLDWSDAQNFGGNDGMVTEMMDGGGIAMYYDGGNDGDTYSGGRGGIPQNWNGGLHYSNKFNNNKQSFNGGYKLSKINAPSGERAFTTSFFGDSSTSATKITNGFSSKIKQALNLTYETDIDSFNNIKYTGKGNLGNTKSSGDYSLQSLNAKSLLINTSSRKTSSDQDNVAFNNSVLWKHKFKKASRTLTLNTSYNISNSVTNGFLFSDNDYYNSGVPYQNDTIDQKYKRENDTRAFSTNFTYTEPLTKELFLSFNYTLNFSSNTNDRLSFSKDAAKNYTVPIDSLDNSYRFKQISNKPGISFRMVKKKYNYSIGTAISSSHFEQDNITKAVTRKYDFTNFFPSASFYVKMKNYQGIRLNYNGSSKAPLLDQLQPIVDNTDQINQRIGNPDLKQSFTHNINAGYNFYNVLKERGMWTNIYGSFTQNAFVNESNYTDAGRSVTRTVNTNGNYNFNFYSNYDFKWKKPNMHVGIGMNGNASRNISFVGFNGAVQKAVNRNTTYGFQGSLRKEKENKYEIAINPGMSWVKSTNSINTAASASYWQFNMNVDGELTVAKKFKLGSDVNFQAKQNDPRFPAKNQYTLWNASLKRNIFKEVLEASLSVNDILNENRGYDRNFYNNQYTETYYTTLKRYWMLSLTWNFNKNHAKPTNDF